MNNLRLFAILFLTIIVMSQVCTGTYYGTSSLMRAVKSVCCDAPNGKRTVSQEKKAVSAFLKRAAPRQRRALNEECCHEGCFSWEVLNTSLYEECIHEGCSVEEIDEVC